MSFQMRIMRRRASRVTNATTSFWRSVLLVARKKISVPKNTTNWPNRRRDDDQRRADHLGGVLLDRDRRSVRPRRHDGILDVVKDRQRIFKDAQLFLHGCADFRRARDPFGQWRGEKGEHKPDEADSEDDDQDGRDRHRDVVALSELNHRGERDPDHDPGHDRKQDRAAEIKRRDQRERAHHQRRDHRAEPPNRRNIRQRLHVGKLDAVRDALSLALLGCSDLSCSSFWRSGLPGRAICWFILILTGAAERVTTPRSGQSSIGAAFRVYCGRRCAAAACTRTGWMGALAETASVWPRGPHRGVRDRRLAAAGRLPPHALDHDRGTGRGDLSARERSAPMGGLVALGEARSERQGLVRRTARRVRARCFTGPATTRSAPAR